MVEFACARSNGTGSANGEASTPTAADGCWAEHTQVPGDVLARHMETTVRSDDELGEDEDTDASSGEDETRGEPARDTTTYTTATGAQDDPVVVAQLALEMRARRKAARQQARLRRLARELAAPPHWPSPPLAPPPLSLVPGPGIRTDEADEVPPLPQWSLAGHDAGGAAPDASRDVGTVCHPSESYPH